MVLNIQKSTLRVFFVCCMMPFPAEGQIPPTITQTQMLMGGSADGHLGSKIAARGNRLAAAWPGVDSVLPYYWNASTQTWQGNGSYLVHSGGVALDDGHLLYGRLVGGAFCRTYDDDTGLGAQIETILRANSPSSVAISFPLAALVYSGGGAYGLVYLYRYNSVLSEWEYLTVASGSSVALSGNWMAVGNPAGDDFTGWVNTFELVGDQLHLRQTLNGFDPSGKFGASLALSGTWLAVGAPKEDISFPFPLEIEMGAVHLYERVDTQFGHKAAFNGQRSYGGFGTSVDLKDTTLAVGAPFEDVEVGPLTFDEVGAAYVYWRSGDTWAVGARLAASDFSPNDYLGSSVAVSDHGVLAGAPYWENSGGQPNGGAVFFWDHTYGIFNDSFETGNLQQWSTSIP